MTRKGFVGGQSVHMIIIIIMAFFFIIMLGTPFFAPAGMTYDSLISFFSKSLAEMMTSETMAGVFLFIIIIVFGILLFSNSRSVRRF